jgi:hypothetical protein
MEEMSGDRFARGERRVPTDHCLCGVGSRHPHTAAGAGCLSLARSDDGAGSFTGVSWACYGTTPALPGTITLVMALAAVMALELMATFCGSLPCCEDFCLEFV